MNKVIAILLIIVLMLELMGCVPNSNANETQIGESSRMVIIEQAYTYDIVYDRYTKVMYAISHNSYNCGNFTLLVDSDGNPLLYGN